MAILKALEASSSTSSSSSPSSPSSSSSTSRSSYTYDVFLSFRSEIRYKFTDHLYKALMNKRFLTFRDKEGIRKGKSLKAELDKAIGQSRVFIIVLSENYVSSAWCLNELVMILDRVKASEHDVLPVFYDLSPSEVRNQSGGTREAFARHERSELKEKVKGWKAALTEVADFAGMELKNKADGYESKIIQTIAKWVEDKVSRTSLFVSQKLIGKDSQIKNINKWLQDDLSKFILCGIYGMGGIGKTVIAKLVYNLNFLRFDACCFLKDVRERSKKSNGLAGLQRQLLSSILKLQHEKIYSVNEGMMMIKEAVSRKSVLLVLDDVDQIDQLNALCGMGDWFCRGSKIITTTRDEMLLKAHEAFKVEELDYEDSVKLFSLYAFGKDCPNEDYIAHAIRVVLLCGGLPLALIVIGSSLSGRTVPYWASVVKKLEAIPPKEIVDKLKISYDCLQDDNDKRVFLDIACFFVGDDKNDTIRVLDSIPDTYTAVGIKNLIDRCLLTIDYSNKLMMHQLVRDMGRNIASQESPEVPGQCSRLWRCEDAYNVLENETGTRKIKGLALEMRMLKKYGDTSMEHVYEESHRTASPLTCIHPFFHCFGCFSSFFGRPVSTSSRISDVDLRTNAFEKMDNLRLLELNYTHLTGCYDKFPKKLVWLCWHGFPLKSLPVELNLNNLAALELCHSKLEEVWAGRKILKSLKILNLSYSKRLVKTPNFLEVPNLEKLILKGCVSLIEICESIECLEELHYLDVSDCKSLRTFPSNMCKLRSLTMLAVRGCSALLAGGVEINAISHLLPQPSRDSKMLWASLPPCLVDFSLPFCELSDDSLPSAFLNLSRLKYLDLSGNLFRSLPDCIKSLSSLQWLSLGDCSSLDSILGLPSNIRSLHLVSTTPMKLRRITFQSTPDQLDEINMCCCYKLVEIEGMLLIEPIEKVDRRIIKNLGIDIELIKNLEVKRLVPIFGDAPDPIQGIYEFGIFNTFIPGAKIPSCFSWRKKGSSMSFIVPSVPKFRIQCLNICSMYVVGVGGCNWGGIKIINKTRDLTWVYIPMYFGIPKKDREEEMTWLSRWNFGNQLAGGDEIVVSVLLEDWFEVKECGINIVYEEEEDNGLVSDNNNETYFHWNEVVGGDLSWLQLHTGTYFLRRQLYQNYNRLNLMERNLNLFGEIASLKEMLHLAALWYSNERLASRSL